MTNMILKIVVTIIVVIIIGAIIFAKSKGVSPLSWNIHQPISQKRQLAIGGFDPVHYFELQSAAKGTTVFTYSWENVNWFFNSTDHLEKFKEDPEKYKPQFGGYCAFAVSKGFTATSNPNAWHIYKGKLYLFADNNVKKQWIGELPQILETCTKKWPN